MYYYTCCDRYCPYNTCNTTHVTPYGLCCSGFSFDTPKQPPTTCTLAGRSGGSFLEREAGLPYVEVFRAIRLQHILNDITSIESIEADRIIPQSEFMT